MRSLSPLFFVRYDPGTRTTIFEDTVHRTESSLQLYRYYMALPAEPVELLASEPGMVAAPKKTRKRIPLTEVAVLAALASAIPGLSDAVVRERTFCLVLRLPLQTTT